MSSVKKRSGDMQEFNRSKLEESMKRAGAKEDMAMRIAEKITAQDGVATAELRRMVGEELRKEDVATADAYLATRRLKAKATPDLPEDAGRVSEYLSKMFEQQKVLQASLYHGARKQEVRVEPAHKNYGEIWLNKNVLDRLAAQDGARIAVRFRRNAGPTAPAAVPPAQPTTMAPPAAKPQTAVPAPPAQPAPSQPGPAH